MEGGQYARYKNEHSDHHNKISTYQYRLQEKKFVNRLEDANKSPETVHHHHNCVLNIGPWNGFLHCKTGCTRAMWTCLCCARCVPVAGANISQHWFLSLNNVRHSWNLTPFWAALLPFTPQSKRSAHFLSSPKCRMSPRLSLPDIPASFAHQTSARWPTQWWVDIPEVSAVTWVQENRSLSLHGESSTVNAAESPHCGLDFVPGWVSLHNQTL